jgi:hypothetical protein
VGTASLNVERVELTYEVDAEGHGLVTVEVEEELPVVLDGFLQLFNTHGDTLNNITIEEDRGQSKMQVVAETYRYLIYHDST